MARYILIDRDSGYIFGDTAVFCAGYDGDLDPVTAARLLDESIGVYGGKYTEYGSDPVHSESGYHVYRADVRKGEAVPVVTDGQDRETIEAVEELCDYVGFVEISRTE